MNWRKDAKWKRFCELLRRMTYKTPEELKDGDECTVIGGTHKGKSGTVHDIKISKTGHITITVKQKNGVRFKTLARNVVVESDTLLQN